MTDKQIIDGCDVSGCPYYHGHDACKNTCHYFGTPCEWVDVQNCDYKTLNKLQAERDSYIDKYFLESQKVLSLNKVLKDIKAIAEHCMKQDICTTCDNSDRCYIEDEEIPTYDICKLVLQKISEVEE